jgi:hypothetical protein
MTRVRMALSILTVCVCAVAAAQNSPHPAFATAAADGVRVLSSPSVVALRVQVFSSNGATVFDSNWKSGNVLDWIAADSLGHPLAYGSYRIVVDSKDLAGQLDRKEATLRVDPNAITVDGQTTSSPRITLLAHDGESGQLISTSGDLSFRFGDYLNRKDTEAMRLSPEGNLDVKGWIRPGQGVVFPDGSTLTSAGSVMRIRASRPPEETTDAKLHPKSDVSGTGTSNQVTKWLGTDGTLGDSAISETGGAVRIGTIAAQGQLQIAGAANQDIFSGMGPNLSGPAFNFGYGGLSFGVGAGFFNVRPAAAAVAPNPSLRFMTINQERMIVTNTGNVGIGTSAPAEKLDVAGNVTFAGNLMLPVTAFDGTAGVITAGGNRFAYAQGSGNVFVGIDAGNFTQYGFSNTGIGTYSLHNNGSNSNTATGNASLYGNTIGVGNTASGDSAMLYNTTGSQNAATGGSALYFNTTGSNNTAVGSGALNRNTTADNNTAIGYQALLYNTTGTHNVAVGYQAGYNNTTADNNTAIGYGALQYNTTGPHNLAVGYQAGQNLTTGHDNIDIDNDGVAGEDVTIRIGRPGTHLKAFLGGVRNVRTVSADTVPVIIDVNGQLGTLASSASVKREIAGIGDASSALFKLRPVSFFYRDDAVGFRQYGLIAEEVAEVMPDLVVYSPDGKPETVRYHFLAPLMLNEIQKEQRTIETLASENAALRERLIRLETVVAGLKAEK